MRLTGSRAYYRPTPPRMPPGMVELMQGLTKEVLKHNPPDVYEFCAGHMQHLLEIRDGPILKKTLTLEEKITIAQKKIGQRAERRRQEYDKNLLHQQQSQNETIEKLNCINEVTQSLSETHVTLKALKMPVHHEEELEKSSEIEISHDNIVTETVKDNPQIKDELKHDVVISNGIEPSTVTETKNVENIYMNENKVNEPIMHTTENNLSMNDDLKNILEEGNIHNKSSDDEEQNTSEYNTDKQSTNMEENCFVNNVQEQIPKINQIEVPETTFVNIDEKQLSETDKQCLLFKEEYKSGSISEITSNNDKIEGSENATNTETIQFSESCHENSLKDKAKSEIDTITINSSFSKHHISDLTNEHKDSLIIELKNDNDDYTKIEDTHRPNEIDDYISPPTISKVENTELSTNSSLVAAPVNEEVNVIDFDTPSVTQSDCGKKDNNQIPKLIEPIEKSIDQIHSNEVKNETLIGDAISPIDENDEEKKKKYISISGDEEMTIHNDLKQDNLNELYMKSSSVTDTGPEVGSNNIDNLSTILEDSTRNAITNRVNKDVENITQHANTENENNSNTVDLETAAITIQKVFRSFLFKSRASTFDDAGNDEENFVDEKHTDTKEENDFLIPSVERRPHGITRMDTVLQTVNEEKSLSLSTDDSSTLSSAATIIQAHVRGFLVRNKLNSNKTLSTNSFPASNSNDPSLTSLENDIDQHKNKTVLNIHIVPEGGNYLSRDESVITSTELSLDGSPPSSINLHPLGHDISERRKQLKREDAIQSISPPSNNSGKLSEEVDSVRDLLITNDNNIVDKQKINNKSHGHADEEPAIASEKVATAAIEAAVTSPNLVSNSHINTETAVKEIRKSLTKISSDEMDVVTPFIPHDDKNSSNSKLMHSGEFHDLVLPTRVSRSDTSVVREFKSVLVYFLLWNPS